MRLYGYIPSVDDTTYHAFIMIESNDPFIPQLDIAVDLRVHYSGIKSGNFLPVTFKVSQNYPNPFNPTTTINYQLPEASDVSLMIYNVLGQKVSTLVNGRIKPGYHSVVWDGLSDEGVPSASGVSIYRFQAGQFDRVNKMLLLK